MRPLIFPWKHTRRAPTFPFSLFPLSMQDAPGGSAARPDCAAVQVAQQRIVVPPGLPLLQMQQHATAVAEAAAAAVDQQQPQTQQQQQSQPQQTSVQTEPSDALGCDNSPRKCAKTIAHGDRSQPWGEWFAAIVDTRTPMTAEQAVQQAEHDGLTLRQSRKQCGEAAESKHYSHFWNVKRYDVGGRTHYKVSK